MLMSTAAIANPMEKLPIPSGNERSGKKRGMYHGEGEQERRGGGGVEMDGPCNG